MGTQKQTPANLLNIDTQGSRSFLVILSLFILLLCCQIAVLGTTVREAKGTGTPTPWNPTTTTMRGK